jgi:hypothetical protein
MVPRQGWLDVEDHWAAYDLLLAKVVGQDTVN